MSFLGASPPQRPLLAEPNGSTGKENRLHFQPWCHYSLERWNWSSGSITLKPAQGFITFSRLLYENLEGLCEIDDPF